MNLPPTGSNTDVTDQVLQSHLIYGSSDNTNPQGLAASKSLNFAQGPSIQRPIIDRVTTLPYRLHYQDTVGLFGAENCFVRVNLDIQDMGRDECWEEPYWLCAMLTRGDFLYPDTYTQALIDGSHFEYTDGYVEAEIHNRLIGALTSKLVRVDLINNKTGNQYVDSWLDVRLYDKFYQEHAYDRMYCGVKDHFYVGFHARNTRRLDYDVTVEIGGWYGDNLELEKPERRYLPAGRSGNISCANTDMYNY